MIGRQIGRHIGIIGSAFVLFYIASYGPVVAYLVRKRKTNDNPGFGTREVKAVYFPIVLVRDRSRAAFDVMLDYSEFCYRVRYGKHPGRRNTYDALGAR